MGTKYSTQSTVNYNAAPPPDDGTKVAANKITWAKIKTKLADEVKTLADSINTALLAHFDRGPVAKTTTYTTLATDFNKILECSGTFTVSLIDAATVGAGYYVTIKNAGVGTITVDTDTAGDGIDGLASVTLAPLEGARFCVNAAAGGYFREQASVVVQNLELVEYADLTNGGADNLSSYEFTHDMEAGYIYIIKVTSIGCNTAGWFPHIRLRNAAGTLITGRVSAAIATGLGMNSAAVNVYPPYYFSGYAGSPADTRFNFSVEVHSPMDAFAFTAMFGIAGINASGITSVAGFSSFSSANVAQDTGILIGTNIGAMNYGEAFLYRIKEPS